MKANGGRASALIRVKAAEILGLVEERELFAETAIVERLKDDAFGDERDKNLLIAIVYGVLRERGSLDWIISRLYRGDFEKLETPIKNILRCALFQLRSLERIPDFAACDEAVRAARQLAPRGVALVNGICREFLRQRANIPAPKGNILESAEALLSHPRWLVAELLKSHSEAVIKAMCAANNNPPSVFLRVNSLKTTLEALQVRLAAEGIITSSTPFSPICLRVDDATLVPQKSKSFAEGFFVAQDEASQLIPYLLAPKPDELVLDLCAGRGIKTSQIAAMMENRGLLLASDIVQGKLKELEVLALKMGATNIKTVLAKNILPAMGVQEMQNERGIEEKRQMPGARGESGLFDKILVDAPCSGTGVIRRHPEIKWRLRAQDLAKLAVTQKRLLIKAAGLLKPGGRLVYATCSVLSIENEAVVGNFLQDNPDFFLEKIAAERWRAFVNDAGFFTTLPDKLAQSGKLSTDMDGFFAASLRKKW